MKYQSKNNISQQLEIANLLDNSNYWVELNSTEAKAISGGQTIPTAQEVANELILGDLTDKSEQFIDDFESGLFPNNPEALAIYNTLLPLS